MVYPMTISPVTGFREVDTHKKVSNYSSTSYGVMALLRQTNPTDL
jgi:hypothetical protein